MAGFVWMAFRTKFCHGIFTKPYISFDHVIQISRTKPTTEVSRLKDKHFLEDRSVELAEYLISQKATVRSTAKKFGVSKSTVHKDITERLRKVNPQLYKQVAEILQINKEERHIRGGMATKRKYESHRER